MKKVILLGLLFCAPVFCQFGIGDAAVLIKLEAQLEQLQAILNNARLYSQLFSQAAAFAHNPAAFLATITEIEQVAITNAAASGLTTSQQIAQLQKMLRMQQVALQEANTLSTLSHGNMAGIGQWANMMSTTSQQLAALNAELQYEQQVAYYQQHNVYRPQSQIVSNWRVK